MKKECYTEWCATCPFHHFPPHPKMRDYLDWKQWEVKDDASKQTITEKLK